MNKLYNSLAEIKLRILLLLERSPEEYISKEMIVAIDFINVYGKEFEVSEYNLNGDSRYKYSEIASRREIIELSINKLVLEGLISFNIDNGFKYAINSVGINYIERFECDYSEEYSKIAKKSFEKYGTNNETVLFKLIQQKAKISVKEG